MIHSIIEYSKTCNHKSKYAIQSLHYVRKNMVSIKKKQHPYLFKIDNRFLSLQNEHMRRDYSFFSSENWKRKPSNLLFNFFSDPK